MPQFHLRCCLSSLLLHKGKHSIICLFVLNRLKDKIEKFCMPNNSLITFFKCQFLSTLSNVCSCFSTMALKFLCTKIRSKWPPPAHFRFSKLIPYFSETLSPINTISSRFQALKKCFQQ